MRNSAMLGSLMTRAGKARGRMVIILSCWWNGRNWNYKLFKTPPNPPQAEEIVLLPSP
jgi:hypothetical protein